MTDSPFAYASPFAAICNNRLADSYIRPAPALLLVADGKENFFYPTGHRARYVRVCRNFHGDYAAQLVIGVDERHPLWKHLTPVTPDPETVLAHLAAITLELSQMETCIPSPKDY